VTVAVNATDAGSGVADVELFVDGNYVDYSRSKGSPYGFTLPAGSLSLGSHKIKAYVADALGNSTFTAPITVTVKDGTPTTTIACDGGACPASYVKGPVSVSLTATDGGAGIGATRYTLDGTDPGLTSPVYSTPFSLAATTTVKFRSWDLASNAEPVRTQVLKIDAVAPTGQIASPADGASVPAAADLTVTVNASDAGSGVADVELFVDGNYVDYSRSKSSPYGFVLPAGSLSLGSHRLKAYLADALGNRSWTPAITIVVG
jgi:archaellum component FlaF (FlaF/FlaG flagellin family)